MSVAVSDEGISIEDAPNGVYYLRNNNQLYTEDK